MDSNNLDFSECVKKMSDSVNDVQNHIFQKSKALAEYQAELDDCVFETRDLLKAMQDSSAKDATIQTKRFIIQTVVSVSALIAAVVAAVAAVIPLL